MFYFKMNDKKDPKKDDFDPYDFFKLEQPDNNDKKKDDKNKKGFPFWGILLLVLIGLTIADIFFLGKNNNQLPFSKFKEMVENDELLEHATYVANSYGTPRKFVEDKLDSGLDVLLDIEVQGARQINEKKPDAVKIFIIPPSLAELRRRLVGRGTDTERAIEARLIRARQEYAEADFYDYIIINDDPDRAAKELAAIMLAERCKAEGRMHFLRDALEE